MNDNDDNEYLKQHIRRSLDECAHHIKPQLLSRLEALRDKAGRSAKLGASSDRSFWPSDFFVDRLRWLPGLGLVLLLLGFGGATYWVKDGGVSPKIIKLAPVDEVLISNEEIEFLNNLEMYQWLATEYGPLNNQKI